MSNSPTKYAREYQILHNEYMELMQRLEQGYNSSTALHDLDRINEVKEELDSFNRKFYYNDFFQEPANPLVKH